MHGWKGNILRVDLNRGHIAVEELSPELARDYIGGRGLGLRMLFDEIAPGTDALAPENKLFFATGPLTGSGVPAGGRFIVVSKSPLSGGIASPCCGGYFGAHLKYSGYDVLVLEGRADAPVYLYIRDDRVEIRPASHLWGRWTAETEKALREEVSEELDAWEKSELSIVSIGPAGENRVRFACIMADAGRAAGRSGLGAVMGAKNLKAIVAHGSGGVQPADPEGFRKAVMDFYAEGRENRTLRSRLMYGTWVLPGRANATGTQAAMNFQAGFFEPFTAFDDPAVIRDQIRVRDEACFGCPFACSKRSRITDPAYPGTAKGPEHESMALLGSNCGIGDLADIFRTNYLCNELGMDTISTGATVSCVMELFERSLIDETEIGYPVRFGDLDAMVRLMKQTAVREGFGDLVAEGGAILAERCGHPELFMGVKGLGMPAWHPQGFEVIGLQYATNNVGASHTKATLPFYEGRKDPAHHVPFTVKDQNFVALVDSTILCWIIYHGPLWAEKLQVWLNVITGMGYTAGELERIGERIWNLERMFNRREGFSRKDDRLPRRMTEEPRVKNQVVDLERMLGEYYALRGWDEQGNPTPEKLRELGLSREGGYE